MASKNGHEPISEETFLETRRERLQKQREDIHAKRAELDDQLTAIDQELYALDVYVQAKAGKRFDLSEAKAPRKARVETGPRAPRGARPALQNEILEVIKKFDGATAETINSELQATDELAKRKISAALYKMTKAGEITQEGRKKPYKLVPAKREVFEPPSGGEEAA